MKVWNFAYSYMKIFYVDYYQVNTSSGVCFG